MNAKLLAMYLPQFHRVKENDEWWGEGFTDWNTVKAAKPLFDKHKQPVKPLNEYYYDLLDKKTLEWQSKLLREYGLNGFCIYHYWFKDGKQILQKPAEVLLDNKDISLEYMFCWANESWTRTWSNLGDSNVWAAKYEQNNDYTNNGILLEQSYGNIQDWIKHFQYLLPFFKDERYIKYDGKPVFVVYRPQLIFCMNEMKQVWNDLAIDNGFNGVYLIFANCDKATRQLADLELIHEPQNVFHSNKLCRLEEIPLYGAFQYEEVLQKSLNYISDNPNVSYGGVVRYDDTPRRGKKGSVLIGNNPEIFKCYFKKLIEKNKSINSPFVFLNAWNEWGEGMYLEPDVDSGLKYLQAIKEVIENVGFDGNEICSWSSLDVSIGEKKIKEKYEIYFELLHNWLLKKEMGRQFSDYLLYMGYRKIAIYGMGILGKHFINEIKDSDIEISYILDNDDTVVPNIPISIRKITEVKNDVDVIVVTVTYAFENILYSIREICSDIKVISLEQIVMEC